MKTPPTPPRSNSANPASPFAKCNDARFCEPASVQSKLPFPKSNAARCCFNSFFPFAPQCSRPAIIKCSTTQISARPLPPASGEGALFVGPTSSVPKLNPRATPLQPTHFLSATPLHGVHTPL